MELTLALTMSILGSVIAVCTFVLNRKYKAIKDKKCTSIMIAFIVMCIQWGITLLGLLLGKVSAYYYYK